jgi:hypothetical protein
MPRERSDLFGRLIDDLGSCGLWRCGFTEVVEFVVFELERARRGVTMLGDERNAFNGCLFWLYSLTISNKLEQRWC